MIDFTYNPIIPADYESRRRHFLTKCLLPTVAYVVLVLKNGKAVIHAGAMVSQTDENQFMQYTYQWLVPVDPDEVDHLEIGTTKIAIL